MSLEFLPLRHSGDAVREIAVQHGLLPIHYPQGDPIGTVLGHVEHELERRGIEARWQFATSLQPVAWQWFNAQDRQLLQEWWEGTRMGFTPIETEDTFTVGDHEVSPVMAQLQRELGLVFASLDDLGGFEKKQMLRKWAGDVHASGLQTHQQPC